MNGLTVRARAAFSLVEVTLALGVAAFCLIAIFGLLPVSMNSNQLAIEQTAANTLLTAVAADLRATPSTVPPGGAANSQQYAISIPANPVGTTAPAPITLYFTTDHKLTTNGTQARYRVTVTFLPNSGAKTATFVNVKASWPAGASVANAIGSVQTFVALDRN